MNAQPNVIEDERDGILTVTINRPERRNAVDPATAQTLYKAFSRFDGDEALQVAILTGADGFFCAGADLKALSAREGGADLTEARTSSLGPMGPTRLRLSKPVIAAIEGHAVAGGAELALWCDLRIMAEDAVFGIFCRRFGVPLVDLGTIRLPRLIGQSRAMDLVLTGRPVDAREAHAMGLANRIAPKGGALAAAQALAREIAGFPQTCLRGDRQSLLQQWGLAEEAAMNNELRHGRATLSSGETLAGARRFAGGEGRHGAF